MLVNYSSMKDYFTSAASYYAQYRPFYPEPLLADIVDFFGLNEQDRVMDIGSGTGQLAIQIAKTTQEVVAVEVDSEMIAEGVKLCQSHAIENIRWIQSAAEELSTIPDLGRFKLATFGASFHWMKQIPLLGFLDSLIEPDGGIAVAGSKSIWLSSEPWEQAAKEITQKYLGEERRAGTGKFKEAARGNDTFENIFKSSPFSVVEERAYPSRWQQSLDEVVGRIYSTSFANPAVLGDKKDAFERDLRSRLMEMNPNGVFEKIDQYYLFLAKRP